MTDEAGNTAEAPVVIITVGPVISIKDITIDETGPTSDTFTITLSGATFEDVTVNWTLTDLTAIRTEDYNGPTSGTATILAGATTATIPLPGPYTAIDDDIDEVNEFFKITLSGPTGGGATIDDETGIGTIIDNEDPISVLNGSIVTNSTGGRSPKEQSAILTFVSTTDPRNSYAKLFNLDDGGQEGNVTEFVSFNIIENGDFTVALEDANSDDKFLLTNLTLEGAVIHGQGDGTTKLTSEADLTNDDFAITAVIDPPTTTPVQGETASIDGTKTGSGGNAVSNDDDGSPFPALADGGGDGVNYLWGGGGDDVLNGSGDIDILNGGAGADILNGMDGNDILVFDPLDTHNGGSGIDILRVDIDRDGNAVNGGDLRDMNIINIEVILLTDFSDSLDTTTGITLALDADDVLAFTDGSATSPTGTVTEDMVDLWIVGNLEDSVEAGGVGNWTFNTQLTVTGGQVFNVYTNDTNVEAVLGINEFIDAANINMVG